MATKHAVVPLPAFSFPQMPDDSVDVSADVNALPAFSFPQAAESDSQPSSPALRPHGRPHGHRRRPSELTIGENITVASPTKSSGSVPTPPSLPAPGPGMSGAPAAGRRGHAHRRSAAISSVDLTAVTKAFPPLPLAGSAPATPADIRQQHLLHDDAARPTSRSFPNMSPRTPPITPDYLSEQSAQAPPQPSHLRVELQESQHGRRPLSTISSEGSVSTARGNHSVTPSSASATQPVSQSEKTHTRPKTAGPRLDLDRSSPESDKQPPREHKRPLSMSASATLSVLGLTHSAKSPNKSPKLDDEVTPPSTSLGRKRSSSSSSNAGSIVVHKTRSSSSPEKKTNKKQKKVRSWAGIISRKTKKRSKKAKKAPTPPPVLTRKSSTQSISESMSDVNFDDDQIIVLRTPTAPSAPSEPPVEKSEERLSLDTSWKPKSFYEQGRELDMYSPVIDLDAALGPFNTPEMPSDPKSLSSFSVATKRMYSGGRRGEFVGPEMRYHRRAESAPVMQPFDRSGLGAARASSLANPDVFYEEDEDAFLAGRDVSKPASKTEEVSTSPVGSPEGEALELVESRSSATVTPGSPDGTENDFDTSGLGIQIVDAADPSDLGDPSREVVDHRPETAKASHEPATPESAHIEASKPEYSGSGCDNDIQIVESDEWPLPAPEEPSKSPSYFSDRRPATSPDLTCTGSKTSIQPEMPTHNPAYPSPNPSHISFDNRLPTTASSSMTDRNTFHSAYSNDLSGEVFHGSTEDVPSLTSSASTMTGNAPRLSSSFYSRVKGDRAASFSANGSRRSSRGNSHKRSSLVSLSKLVTGSTTCEKSKLSYEEKAPSDDGEKAKKKGHRISRLMQFWKVKEKEKTKERAH